jgi:hypothetical protein
MAKAVSFRNNNFLLNFLLMPELWESSYVK